MHKSPEWIQRLAWLIGLTILACIFGACSTRTPSPQPAIKIMPLGDSITQANAAQESFRRPLWHLIHADGFQVDFVGSTRTQYGGPNPQPDFDLDHEGHGGWTADRILARLPA